MDSFPRPGADDSLVFAGPEVSAEQDSLATVAERAARRSAARARWAALWGTAAILALAAAAHSVHDGAGRLWLTALVFPVNESAWEHARLATWPGLLVLAIQRWWLGADLQRPGLAFAAYAVIAPSMVAIFYDAYTGALGVHGLAYDLVVLAPAVISGQVFALQVGRRGLRSACSEAAGWLVVALVALASIAWTFWPPDLPLFRAPL